MTPEQLLEDCRRQQFLLGALDASVVYQLASPKRWGRSTHARLWRGGPKGEIVADQFPGPGVIAMFRADDVIEAVEREMARSRVPQ